MSDRSARFLLLLTALSMLAGAVGFLLLPPDLSHPRTQADVRVLATRLSKHPADWAAASALSEVALDTRLETRTLLWSAAFEHASLLAPERNDPRDAFARAAFFHWDELSARDRREALTVYAPRLRDPAVFARMAKPIFELTGDLSYLQQAGAPSTDTAATVAAFALMNGRFDDYRILRGVLQQQRAAELAAQRRSASPEDLVSDLPTPPFHSDIEPSIRELLNELHTRPLVEPPSRGDIADALVDYALRHGLGPLDGLEVISRKPSTASRDTQIRLARALGLGARATQLELASNDPRRVKPNEYDWQGLCESDVCSRAWRTIDAAHRIVLTLSTVETDDTPAYEEVYVDDVLRDEGTVGALREVSVPADPPGAHRIEVVLANPTTRNQTRRRIHIVSVTAL